MTRPKRIEMVYPATFLLNLRGPQTAVALAVYHAVQISKYFSRALREGSNKDNEGRAKWIEILIRKIKVFFDSRYLTGQPIDCSCNEPF